MELYNTQTEKWEMADIRLSEALALVSLQSSLETSFLNCNCHKRPLKYIDKIASRNFFSKSKSNQNKKLA